MYGVQIAFRKFTASKGIWGSPWVGLDNFERFFKSYQFTQTIRNTVVISGLSLILGFPMPVIFALMLNQVENQKFKKLVQTVSYAPHFISVVVLVGMLFVFLSVTSGPINTLIKALGGEAINFMGSASLFKWVYVFSGIWQTTGYSAIIYIAALSAVSPEYYEAAMVDGATRLQRVWYIDVPMLLPTICIQFILNSGRIMSVGFQKAYLMQTSLNLSTSEIISTYVYKVGLVQADYSFSTAIDLFNTAINLVLIFTVNGITRKLSAENSLW